MSLSKYFSQLFQSPHTDCMSSVQATIQNINKKQWIQLFSLIIFMSMLSCGKKQTEDSHDHDHAHAEEPTNTASTNKVESAPSIVTLSDEQFKTIGVDYGNIEMKELTATIRANGNLKVPNNNKASVTSLYGGAIKTINVQVGDYVKKGQVIATIANPEFVQLQEEYLTTLSQITFAEQELDRQEELFNNNAGTKKNLQNADATLKSLRTRRASLQKQIQMMGINPTQLSNNNLHTGLAVVAPISGIISNVLGQVGSYADVSTPVAEIVDNAALHLDLNIFEKDLPLLKVGQIIHFTLTNNPTNEYDAVVFSIGSSFENDSKTIPVHAKVSGSKTGLIDGMNITGIVSLDNVLTPAVPNDAIVNSEGKKFIFIRTNKEADSHAHDHDHDHDHGSNTESHEATSPTEKGTNFEKIEVVTGVSDMGYTAITAIKEIPKGAKVVTKGAFFINAKLTNAGAEGHSH